MGSRAVVAVCQDESAAQKRFGVSTGEVGSVYTRTGRRFFNEITLEKQFLERLRNAADGSGLWDELGTEWMMPDLFRIGASSLLTDIERQLEYFVTGRYSAAHRHPMP